MTDPGIRQILFPTDFSEPSHAAAPFALAHARRWGATLHLLYVSQDGASPPPELAALAKELGADVPITTACVNGKAADEILAYADAHAIDLIVLGSHGRSGMSRVLLGSVAERVTRLAGCPVLTVPRLSAGATAPAVAEPKERELGHCVVCAAEGSELICASCRDKIRGEALGKKLEGQRRA